LADPNDSPRIARAIGAEEACRQAGGCNLRLAGLYSLQRGPHNFWLTSDKGVSGGPSGIINMLHYDDAASACLAALKAGPGVCSGQNFLISDGNPITRKEICESALKNKIYESCSMPEFLGSDAPLLALGKIYDGSVSNRALQWKPKYKSFDSFMSQ
jgi:nucleoside-diphosphate-sugar epimerase